MIFLRILSLKGHRALRRSADDCRALGLEEIPRPALLAHKKDHGRAEALLLALFGARSSFSVAGSVPIASAALHGVEGQVQ
jgi:hypothetical protein